MKILVTGANGQLGQTLIHCPSSQHQIIGLTRAQLDITDVAQVAAAVKHLTPALIMNAAAYTHVDQAEQEQTQALAINSAGAANLARCCAEQKIPLLHLSTDYVFSGQQQTPYGEEDLTSPINIYGQSKLAGEQAIQQYLDNAIIVRVSGVFSEYGNNFVKTILRLAREKTHLRIVADTLTCPTATIDIAHVLLTIADFIQQNPLENYAGIYHFCSNEPVSWHQFAEAIVAQASQLQTLSVQAIQAITTADYPTPAQRPAYSVLATQKLQNRFSVSVRSWRAGLAEILPKVCL